jgi:hypothetical protein
MANMMMDMDGCDIAHETLLLEEYCAEVRYAGWTPQFLRANDRTRATPRRVTRPSDLEEDLGSIGFVRSKSLPKCP